MNQPGSCRDELDARCRQIYKVVFKVFVATYNDTAAELGRNPVSKHQIQPGMEMSRLTRDGTTEPVSRDQILRHERGQGNIHFSCSADHVQDWQRYPVDPYSCYMCDRTIYNMYLRAVSCQTVIFQGCAVALYSVVVYSFLKVYAQGTVIGASGEYIMFSTSISSLMSDGVILARGASIASCKASSTTDGRWQPCEVW